MPADPTPSKTAKARELEKRARNPLTRTITDGHAEVSYLELFFDLVFVFAITQLSHMMLADLSPAGALRTAILFFAVWWAWIYTTWVTNWLDPDHGVNRLAFGVVMGLSLLLGSAIPTAFGHGGATFVAAYLTVQIGRSLYASYALDEWRGSGSTNLLRIALWFALSAIAWLIGLLDDDLAWRAGWWAAALAIEYAGPYALFWVPRLGRSTPEDWIIAGNHMAERCALFIIIALGESLLITGAIFAKTEHSAATTAAFVSAFVSTFAMWWVYFDLGARRGAEHIEHHPNPGLVGRQAYTYWHIPIVAGIILLAVADEFALTHPLDPSHAPFVAVVAGGLALFVGGNMSFKRITSGNPWYPLSHSIGLGLTAAIAAWGLLLHPSHLALALAGAAVLIIVAAWEWVSFHGGWLERMERRGWRVAGILRRRIERRRKRHEAKAKRSG
ncbi:MAG: low temperature requirement protein A [Novosphingobium sp.]|nr:low temperature requirement protein A [Novosphingobium sp.]